MKPLIDMIKDNYTVEVIVNGRPLKEYIHEGRVYLEGKKNSTFSLRLRNNSWKRKLFIPAVDGLSVMDGEDAGPDSGGYIVNPHSSITIDGWRKSDEEVAEFYFTDGNKSYRKRMKKGDNLGVIGVMVFDEYEPPVYFSGYASTSEPMYLNTSGTGSLDITPTVTMSCSTGPVMRSMKQELGTGWGDSKRSEVVSVKFEKTGSPTEFEIFYNTRKELEKMGIHFGRQALYVAPQAFPGRYCQPPRN